MRAAGGHPRERRVAVCLATVAVLAITLYLMKHDPQLLVRRVNAGPGAETAMVQIQRQLPAAVKVETLYDRSQTIEESVHEVKFTLYLTLCLVVLNTATAKKTEGNSFYGLAIGFTIVVAAFAGGPISGGAFNPAVGIGPTVVNAMSGAGGYSSLWLYLLGPLLGGVVAALVFKMQEASA